MPGPRRRAGDRGPVKTELRTAPEQRTPSPALPETPFSSKGPFRCLPQKHPPVQTAQSDDWRLDVRGFAAPSLLSPRPHRLDRPGQATMCNPTSMRKPLPLDGSCLHKSEAQVKKGRYALRQSVNARTKANRCVELQPLVRLNYQVGVVLRCMKGLPLGSIC